MKWVGQLWDKFRQLFGGKADDQSVSRQPSSPHPQKFYHGTQTAIHLLANTYLDPQFATGGDEGDPQKPHVFVTADKLMAKIFALKANNVTGISITKSNPIIEFSSEPKNLKGGWIYTCPENPEKPFEEIIVRGQHTGKWVSYDKVPITEQEYVPGLEHLMRHDNLQVYILKDGIDLKEWGIKSRNAAYTGGLANFYAEQIQAGNVRHLNAELGIAPMIDYRNDWSKQPRNQSTSFAVTKAASKRPTSEESIADAPGRF